MRRSYASLFWIVIILTGSTGCGDNRQEAKTEEGVRDSLANAEDIKTRVAQFHVERHPLPFAPAIVQYLDTVNLENPQKVLLELDKEQLLIFDSLNKLNNTDTIPTIERAAQIVRLKLISEELSEKKAVIQWSICGSENDLKDIALYRDELGITKAFVAGCAPGVGMLLWKPGLKKILNDQGIHEGDIDSPGACWGSGALINDRYFLTALHCFSPGQSWKVPSKNGIPLSPEAVAKLMRVVFNFQSDRTDTVTYEIDSLMELGINLDYAIVRLKKRGGEWPGEHFRKLDIAQVAMVVSEPLCIIQHPSGGVKKVAVGRSSFSTPPFLEYPTLDTKIGSSGAPILSQSKNGLVGIHVIGECNEFNTRSNKGISIQAIAAQSRVIKSILGIP